MRRVLVMGPPGSGKSTLARELGRRLELPVVHLDALNFEPGWVELRLKDFRYRVAAAAAGERWVMDGSYPRTFDLRLPHADTVILLDLPKWVTIPRAVGRWLRFRGRQRPDAAPGCPEKFDREFLWYMLTRKRGPQVLSAALRAHSAHASLIVLRSPRAVGTFLRQIQGP